MRRTTFKLNDLISIIFPIFIINILSSGSLQTHTTLTRQRRSMIEFALMVAEMTQRFPLDFNNYGRYCGFGGSGIPVDEIDRCCQIHDECYSEINETCNLNIGTIGLFIQKYQFVIREQEVFCIHSTDNSPCGEDICLCDKGIAECFAKHIDKYNSSYLYIR